MNLQPLELGNGSESVDIVVAMKCTEIARFSGAVTATVNPPPIVIASDVCLEVDCDAIAKSLGILQSISVIPFLGEYPAIAPCECTIACDCDCLLRLVALRGGPKLVY